MTVLPASTQTPPPALGARPPTAAKPAINSDFDTFLRMLTTQLQNQDPLSPMDSSEFAVQLATFSGVEQQMQTNGLLKDLGGQLGVMGLSELAGWVGREARAAMPVWFDGTPVAVTARTDPLASSSELVVRNAAGAVVGREPVPAGGGSLTWDGTGDDGARLPSGRYDLVVENRKDETILSTQAVESYGRIVEARGGPTGTTLLFEGGIEVPAASVTALRNGV